MLAVLQINNGVYRSGFATMQGAYERAQADLYSAFDAVERRLSQQRFLVGDRCAEAALITPCSGLIYCPIAIAGAANRTAPASVQRPLAMARSCSACQ